MADFSFDAPSENRGNGNETVGSNGGETGSGSGSGETVGVGNATDGSASGDSGATVKKRRGRPPGSRNAPKSGPDAGTATDKGDKVGLDLGFKKNDRIKVLSNIAGIHMMAAVLTKQPVMMLSDKEARDLTNALCDVADYHHINLDGAGGPFGLYAALATTAYGIYVPRIIALKTAKDVTVEGVAAPATPGETKARAANGAKPMDFSGDINSTVN